MHLVKQLGLIMCLAIVLSISCAQGIQIRAFGSIAYPQEREGEGMVEGIGESGSSELILDHFNVKATKFWDIGEDCVYGCTYIISDEENIPPGTKHFEAKNDTSWDGGFRNGALSIDLNLPDRVPIVDGRYNFSIGIKAIGSWSTQGLGVQKTAYLDIFGEQMGQEGNAINRQVTLTNETTKIISGEFSNSTDTEMAVSFDSRTSLVDNDYPHFTIPAIHIEGIAVYKASTPSNQTNSI